MTGYIPLESVTISDNSGENIRESFERELKDHIIPFWLGLKDEKGFMGEVDFDLTRRPAADKGVILNSRILWFFSTAYTQLGDPELLEAAKHAFVFLRDHCLDREYGGVYWMMSADGEPVDDQKHTYCQAFAVYGLSAYYEASGDGEALSIAMALSEKIEECRDEYGYKESFTREWKLRSNEELSENGLMASKTMNTSLHVVEAYTALCRVSGDARAAAWLASALRLFPERIFNPAERRLEVFFDERMNSLADMHSFGHDIEASWLLWEAAAVLGDGELARDIRKICVSIGQHVKETALNRGRLDNEYFEGKTDHTHIWWVQAEGVLGFMNLYLLTDDPECMETAKGLWRYIREKIIDGRQGSEGYYDLDDDDRPVSRKEIAGPWKCPYHDGRMCLKMLKLWS